MGDEYTVTKLSRPDITTMFKIRAWERYRFMIDYEHEQVYFYFET
jgi:hypothetical protein